MSQSIYGGKKDSYAECIRGSRMKATPARVSLLAALANVHKPISIKEIGKRVTAFDQSTLYRALETLVLAKLVKKVTVGSAESLYETLIGRRHHHHIVCTSCGFMEDVDACAHIPSPKILASKGFTKITDHSLEFFGLCRRCAA